MGATTRTSALLGLIGHGATVHDLGRPLQIGMPQSPNHPPFWHSLPRRHGDTVRADGGSAANDIVVLGCHVGTHIDAVAHVSHDGRLHGDLDAMAEQVGGRFLRGGIHQVAPMVCRGLLLDVPATLGLDACAPAYEITPEDLDATVERQGTVPADGDVLLVRSGWAQRWTEREAYIGAQTGVPGVGEPGARWLAGRNPRAAGADTIAFERLPPGAGHALLPAHRVLLVESGINIIETMNLEGLAAAGAYEFLFVLSPLPIVGATGSPVRPLAVTLEPSDEPMAGHRDG
jgi:kynurenine formamidase